MCGLARCGKSTWIEKNKGDAVVVCPDEVRAKIFGHQFHRPAEPFVWAVVKSMVRMLLDQDKNVILDATNLTDSSRRVWLDMADEYGTTVRVVWIQTPLEECKRRSRSSVEGNIVPDEVLDRMEETFEPPWYPDVELVVISYNELESCKTEQQVENQEGN
jgi:predicted kinase